MKNNSSGGRRGCGDRAMTAPSLNAYGGFGGQQLAEAIAAAPVNIGDFKINRTLPPQMSLNPILFPPLMQQQLDAAAARMDSSTTSTSGDSSSELSSFAASSASVPQLSPLPLPLPPPASLSSAGGEREGEGGGCKQAPQQRAKRPDSPRVIPQAAGGGSSDTSSSGSSGGGGGSSRSSNSSSSFGCESGSLSFPESEVHWSDLRALKPLINPNRLQALRLCTRDQHHSRIHDGGDATIVARPTSPHGRSRRQQRQQHRLETGTNQSQQTLTCSYQHCMDSPEASQAIVSAAAAAAAAAAVAAATTANEPLHCGSSYGGRSEIRMAASGNDLSARRAIYQYSFRIPDTKTNMRAFSDTGDRRIEAIARACDSEVSVDPEPIRVAGSSMRLRRVTIRAPDPHSLEKCCRMFDDKFPHFYVSGGLGPGGRCISKVYDDGDERYISMSHDEWS